MKAKPLETEVQARAPAVKKPYEAPVLKDWGTLRDITLSNSNQGNSDGGRPPFHKTR